MKKAETEQTEKKEKKVKAAKPKKKIDVKSLLPRWSSKSIRNGSYSIGACILVVAIVVVINMIVQQLPTKYTSFDLSDYKLASIGDETKEVLANLNQDVTIYLIAEDGNENSTIERLLTTYKESSSHITVEQKDPVVNPSFVSGYTDEDLDDNSLIVVSGERSKVVAYDDLYEYSLNSYSYSYTASAFDGEGQITSAIDYVTSEDLPIMYRLTGHDEGELSSNMTDLIDKGNIDLQDLNLVTEETVPDDASALLIYAPTKDISEDEATKILNYLEGGGKAYIVTNYSTTDMPNLDSVLSSYGLETKEGIVLEGSTSNYMTYPFYLIPNIASADATGSMSDNSVYMMVPYAQAVGTLETYRDTITITNLLTTTDSAYIKADPSNITSYAKENGDESGTFTLAAAVTEEVDGGETQLIWIGSSYLFEDSIDAYVSGGNSEFFSNSLSWLVGLESTVSIASKSLSMEYLTVTASSYRTGSVVLVILLPAICLVMGAVIWFKRRRQ